MKSRDHCLNTFPSSKMSSFRKCDDILHKARILLLVFVLVSFNCWSTFCKDNKEYKRQYKQTSLFLVFYCIWWRDTKELLSASVVQLCEEQRNVEELNYSAHRLLPRCLYFLVTYLDHLFYYLLVFFLFKGRKD